MQKPRIFISACEPSGDHHGALIAKDLLNKWPNCQLGGIGGPKMQSVFRLNFDQRELAVMGFFDVLMALPRLIKHFRRIKRHLVADPPDLIITIDYPVGHLLLLSHLKQKKIFSKWLHFIAPSMWVGGNRRLRILKKHADHLAVIFPHEIDILKPLGLPCTFVGNPLALSLKQQAVNEHKIARSPLIALFPGSRQSEIERNLPLLIQVGVKLASALKGTLAVSCCREKDIDDPFQKLIAKICGESISIVYPSHSKKLMQDCSLALAVSGTICLELALLKVPTIVIYSLGIFDWFIARFILRLSLRYYSLPNLLANKEIFPEFIGKNLDIEAIYQCAKKLALHRPMQQQCRDDCEILRILLSQKPASSVCDIADGLLN